MTYMDGLNIGGLKVSEQRYAGHTLAEIKAAAENYLDFPLCFEAITNPATVLAMAARIEELERKTAAVDRIVSFLRDDAAAISYQSLWQYRTAALCVARQHPSVAIDAAMEQTKNREGI